MSDSSSRAGIRRALVIGIDAYQERPLTGCVNDARTMTALLQERFAFDAANITLLLDGAASLANVNAELERLLQVTQAEDTVCFYYAGHGCDFEQDNHTETTGNGSTFCLSENPREDLYDFQFGAWLNRLADRTKNVVVLVDACHSGTISRDASALDMTRPMVRQTRGPSKEQIPPRPADAPTRRIASVASPENVMLAACRDDQKASETFLDDDKTTTGGAFTLMLTRELRAADSGTTWQQIHDRLKGKVATEAAKFNRSQEPVVEGKADRVLFGLEEFRPVSPFVITDRRDTVVEVNAGAMHGIVKGMVFTIHPDIAGGTGATIGSVMATQVRGTTCLARVLRESDDSPLRAGARALPSLRNSADLWLARENTSATNRLRGKVSIELLRETSEMQFTPVTDDPPVFRTGDRFAVRITNNSDVPLYLWSFYFGPEGDIAELRENSAPLTKPRDPSLPDDKQDNYFFIGTVEGDQLYLDWNGESATAHIKLFATTQPTSFRFLTALGTPAREATPMELADTDDWTTVTLPLWIESTRTLEEQAPVDVNGVTVRAKGVKGRVIVKKPKAVGSTRDGSDPIGTALADEGLVPQVSFDLTDAELVNAGARGDGDAAIELELPDPGDGYAQLVRSTDEDGLVRWHIPGAINPTPSTRDGRVPTIHTRTVRLDITPSGTATPAAGERSIATSIVRTIVKKVIDVFLFPVGRTVAGAAIGSFAHDLELRRVPYRVRTFTPADYSSRDAARTIDADGWTSLASGRALLMIHGTTSSSHSAFAALPRDVVEALHTLYEGRVFAFDHPTLTHTPKENVQTFFNAMPEGTTLEVDIICHSRGGLVSRVLSERQDQILVPGRAVAVRKIVFVGSPNAGTRLCDEDFATSYLDTFTNMLEKLPFPGTPDILSGVLVFAKILAAGLYDALTGIHSMQPDGLFGKWLNLGTRQDSTRYYALASDYKPTNLALARLVTYVLAKNVFGDTRNDMVVPTDGVFSANGSSAFPIADTVTFDGRDGIPHTGFFGDPRVTAQILSWLRA